MFCIFAVFFKRLNIMDERLLREVLAQQQGELKHMPLAKWTHREEENLLELDSPLAQIVIGVRRSGKSTLCHLFLNKHHIHYAYINFDDERLKEFSSDDFDKMLVALQIIYGDYDYLFMDEPQNIDTWHLFVNRMLRLRKHIFLTGSNAKLLSGELATHLTGRYNQVVLYPLSFKEYLVLKDIPQEALLIRDKAALQVTLEEYLLRGALPETLHLARWQNYLRTLHQSIIERDIIQRFHVRFPALMRDLSAHLVANFCRECNYAQLAKQFGSSDQTIRTYVGYMTQAYLFIPLQKFSYKSRIRLRSSKLYLVDVGFASAMNDLIGDDTGWKLDNIVYLELLRRSYQEGYQIYFFRENYEIDFVLCKGRKVIELIQVCVDLRDAKTERRELQALVNGATQLQCEQLTLITLSGSRAISHSGHTIHIVNAKEWL